ncbi:MAG: hypothetical protein ACE15D_10500 [Candidatus Eisenbacteria bacterium]
MKAAIRFLFLLLLCIVAALPAVAGKNAGGALIVHTNDQANYFRAGYDYCAPPYDAYLPPTCQEAVTRSEKDPSRQAIIWFLAALPASSEPAIAEIRFGVRHNLPISQGFVTASGACGFPPIQAQDPGPGFPDTPGGNRIVYAAPVEHTFFPFYWFAVYGLQWGYFGTGPDPRAGYASFIDDNTPPVEDPIERFGEVRWYQEGYNQCPDTAIAACCRSDGTCVVDEVDRCLAVGAKVYYGILSCDPDPCGFVLGACCTELLCTVVSRAVCEAAGGDFAGEETLCDPSPCSAPGACCRGTTCSMERKGVCLEFGGSWKGEGVPCDPNPCDVGACCFDSVCTVILHDECDVAGGQFAGNGSTCDPNPCLAGACCVGHQCTVESRHQCKLAGGEFHGPASQCYPNPCGPEPPPGACCFLSSCTEMSVLQCEVAGGEFFGEDVPCEPNPCPNPGACCLPDGSCAILHKSACLAAGGVWTTENIPCDPDPCHAAGAQPTAVQPTTWGRIRATYR